jgi:hypothetical protein
MIEDRLADEFRTAVADEPPLGFDPDDVVTEAIRRRKRRQAAGATALATGGVALAAVAVFATSSGTGGVSVGAGPSGSSAVQTATTPPGANNKNTPVPASPSATGFPGSENAIARLEQVIPPVLRDQVPGLVFDKPDSGTLMVVEGRHGVGGAYLAAGTTHRYVTVFVYHDRDGLDLAGDPSADGGSGVLVSDTPQQDGSHLRVYSYNGGDSQALTVIHLRTDGVIVQADTTAKPEEGQTGLAASQEVLTAVATDPRLTF